MRIVNFQTFPYFSQQPVGGIEKCITGGIILWSGPLPFHYPPKSLDNIQMREVWRNVEDKESPLFPNRTHLSNLDIPVYTGIVKRHNCLFVNSEGILFKKVDNLSDINSLTCAEDLEAVITVNHPKDIQSFSSFRRYKYIISGKLPSVWDIAFGTNMRFITVKEVDFSLDIAPFKFLQLLCFIYVELRRGCTL